MFLESSKRPSAYLQWSARILTLSFALFISLFAFDVFDERQGFWTTVLALLMHLTPTLLILALLGLAWNRSWIGAIFFALLGIGYLVWAHGRFERMVYLVIAGPLFLISILFLLGWWQRQKENAISKS